MPKRSRAKGENKVRQAFGHLERLQVEYVPVAKISPNSYNPNRQSEHDFELLIRSMESDGFCVAAETPVLGADLTWKPAGDIASGDLLIALSEHPEPYLGRRHGRRFKTAQATFNGPRMVDLLRVVTEHGEVRCTPDHPWLVTNGHRRVRGWREARNLIVGNEVVHLFEPWKVDRSYEAGWLSGFLDGEGTFPINLDRRNQNMASIRRLAVYQRPGPTADRLVAEMRRHCPRIAVRVDKRTVSNPKWSDMLTVRIDALGDIMQFMGIIRPQRLMNELDFWSNRSISGTAKPSRILAIEPCGRGEIASLATTSQTYIAGGFAMHNTQPIIVQRDTREIVDGEHRWTAGIVTEALRRRGLESTPANIAEMRSLRVSLLDELGDFEIPVVFTDMTAEQMRISTLRHNRARGTEDFDLTAAMFRDLQALGALDVAQDELMLDDVEMNLLLGEENAPDALAGDEYGEAWEPSQAAQTPSVSEDGRQQTAMTPQAIEEVRRQEQRIREASNEEERAAARRDSNVFRMALVFAGEEATIVKTVLGNDPATKILSICKELYSEETRSEA